MSSSLTKSLSRLWVDNTLSTIESKLDLIICKDMNNSNYSFWSVPYRTQSEKQKRQGKASQTKLTIMCIEKTCYGGCGHTHERGVRCQNKKTGFFCFWSKSKPCREFSRYQSQKCCYQCVDTGRDMFLAPPHVSRQGPSIRDSYIDASANRGVAELPSYALNDRPFIVQPAPSRPQAESSSAHSPRPRRPRRGESLRQTVSTTRSALLVPTWTHTPSRSRSPSITSSVTMQRGRSVTPRHRSNSNDSMGSLVSAVSEGPMNARSVSPDDLDAGRVTSDRGYRRHVPSRAVTEGVLANTRACG